MSCPALTHPAHLMAPVASLATLSARTVCDATDACRSARGAQGHPLRYRRMRPTPSQLHPLPSLPTFMTSSTELLVSIRAFIAAMLLATASRTALLRVMSSVDGMEAAANVLASCTSCVMSAPEFRSARRGGVSERQDRPWCSAKRAGAMCTAAAAPHRPSSPSDCTVASARRRRPVAVVGATLLAIDCSTALRAVAW